MEEAGRPGVAYGVSGNLLKLVYTPQTQAMIGTKTEDGMKVEVHSIGPPDGVMARVWLEEPDDFYLVRECIGGFDMGGPWTREHRNLEELNKYLALFGLKHLPTKENMDYFNIAVVEPVDPPNPYEDEDETS